MIHSFFSLCIEFFLSKTNEYSFINWIPRLFIVYNFHTPLAMLQLRLQTVFNKNLLLFRTMLLTLWVKPHPPFLCFHRAADDKAPIQASWLWPGGREGHQRARLLQTYRLGTPPEQGDTATLQAQSGKLCEHTHTSK